MSSNVWQKSGTVRNMFPEPGTTNGALTGAWLYKDSPQTTYQATVSGTGAVTATVVIEYSNDVNPATGLGNALSTVGGTITLTGTTVTSDGFTTSNAPWKWSRARTTAISGTGATVQVYQGV